MFTKEEQDILESLGFLLVAEEFSVKTIRECDDAKKLADTRIRLLDVYRAAIDSGNIDLMLAVENKTLLETKERYANSDAMLKSLNAALSSIDLIRASIDIMRDPSGGYRNTLVTHARKMRKGVPYDSGREAISGHFTRLVNLDKSNLTDEEKDLIDMRQKLVREVEKLYIGEQKLALGISPENNSVPPVPALPTSVLRMLCFSRDLTF